MAKQNAEDTKMSRSLMIILIMILVYFKLMGKYHNIQMNVLLGVNHQGILLYLVVILPLVVLLLLLASFVGLSLYIIIYKKRLVVRGVIIYHACM